MDYSTDLILIKEGRYEELFQKFERLVAKSYKLYNSKASEIDRMDFEDYKGFAFEQMISALKGLKIYKIPEQKRKTWGFHFQFSGYLRSYNKSMIHKSMARQKNEKSVETKTEDGKTFDIPCSIDFAAETEKKEFWQSFKTAYKKLNKEQKVIWDGRLQKKTAVELQKKLGISSYKYSTFVNESKLIFQNELRKTGLDFEAFV